MHEKFLNTVFRDKPDDEMIVVLRKAFIPQFIQKPESAVIYDTDMYVGCCTMPMGIKGRGKKTDAIGMYAFWIDIDFADDEAHKKKNLPTQKEADKWLLDFPQPSMVVNSGYGYHLWYLFNEPVRFVDNQEREMWENRLKAFELAFKQKYNIDSTHNLDRLLRLPGTYNHKKKERKEVTAVYNDVRYDWQELNEYAIWTEKRKTVAVSEITVKVDSTVNDEKFAALCRKNRRFKGVHSRMIANVGDGSPSAYDFSLAIMCCQDDWTDQEITDCIISSRQITGEEIPVKVMNPKYMARTIGKARAYIQSESENGADISTFSTAVGLEVKKFLKYLSYPPTYKLITEKGNIEFDCIDKLLSVAKFGNQVAQDIDTVLSLPKQKEWKALIRILIENPTRIDLGYEGTDQGIIELLLKQYIDETGLTDDPVSTADIFHTDEHGLCVHLESFRRYMDINNKQSIPTKKLSKYLRILGFQPQSVRHCEYVGRCWVSKTYNEKE